MLLSQGILNLSLRATKENFNKMVVCIDLVLNINDVSSLESNNCIIMKAGALEPLVKLLNEGPLLAMKDAAQQMLILVLSKKIAL